jgi:arsenate reductase
MKQEKITIFHNPRCSKSREALDYLTEGNCEIEIVQYLKDVPSKQQLETLIQQLEVFPLDIIRQNEQVFKDNYKGQTKTADEWIDVMIEHPILIERPIIIQGNKAIVGRPPVLVKELINR